METITFHCKVITPMFLAGADGQTPELRAPSIKGAMRFWARAISLGWPFDENGIESHKRLLKEDEALFGGVTVGQRRSLVDVSVKHGALNERPFTSLQLDEGGKYLLYSLIADGYQTERKCISEDTSFAVVLRSKDQAALRKATAVFWVLVHFGALGTRARRGAGAFSVVMVEGNAQPKELDFIHNIELGGFLKKGLAVVFDIFQVGANSPRSANYSTLGNAYLSSKPFSKWEDAVNDIGSHMLKHRKAIPNRDRSLRKFTMETLDQKAAFGLPVSVREDHSANFIETEDAKYTRRASPVFVTVLKDKDQFRWMVTKLEGRLTPEGVSIEFHSKNPKAACDIDYLWPEADPVLLDSFFELIERDTVRIKIPSK